jgi:hypothetical protein
MPHSLGHSGGQEIDKQVPTYSGSCLNPYPIVVSVRTRANEVYLVFIIHQRADLLVVERDVGRKPL